MKQIQNISQKQTLILNQSQINSLNLMSSSYNDMLNIISKQVNAVPYFSVSINDQANDQRSLDWVPDSNSDTLSRLSIYTDLKLEIRDKNLLPIVGLLIDNLDSRGFLPNYTKIIAKYHINSSLASRALSLIQNNSYPGLGARSVQECLMLQLKSKNHVPTGTKEIISKYLLNLADNQLVLIKTNLGLTTNQLNDAIEFIRSLNPGYSLDEGSNKVVVPEIKVNLVNNKPTISLISRNKLSFSFDESFFQSRDAESLKFLKKQKQKAAAVVNNYQRREDTLLLVASSLVSKQASFFQSNGKNLIPVTEKEIAADTDYSISTISRTVNEKYFECDFGIFPLSKLIAKQSVVGISQDSVLDMISKLIQHEDKTHPLTDNDLVEKLASLNVNVSRRTVVKYRKLLNIDNSFMRFKKHVRALY